MLHIAKLAVGIRDLPHLRDVQAARLASEGALRHLTRNTPRQRAAVLDGGSLYWVVAGTMLARQRILDLTEATLDGGGSGCAIVLDPDLVPVAGRATRAFQGWRYLAAAAAPPDLAAHTGAKGVAALPEDLRRALAGLALL